MSSSLRLRFLTWLSHGSIADNAMVCIKRANQLCAREDPPRLAGQLAQQAEFNRSQGEQLAVDADLESLFVQDYRLNDRRILRAGSTKHGADSGDDFAWTERLADVVVGTEFETEADGRSPRHAQSASESEPPRTHAPAGTRSSHQRQAN